MSALLKLEELEEFYPDTRIFPGSSGFAFVTTHVRIFRSLPRRARLYFEVPLDGVPTHGEPGEEWSRRALSMVPDVRAWAVWDDGVVAQAYHRYPDLSICAFMPGEWRLGRDPLKDYAHWCVCWLGKLLHDEFLDRWPGPQHATPQIAVQRNKPDEYCRCGLIRVWRSCHMAKDLSRSSRDLLIDAYRGQQRYLRELGERRWPATPSWRREG